MVGYPRPRWRRRRQVDASAPRPLGCFWPLFWLILLVVLLGLLFGGYRKGTKVGAPERVVPVSSYSYPYSLSQQEYTGT
jgi:hypothetical protein